MDPNAIFYSFNNSNSIIYWVASSGELPRYAIYLAYTSIAILAALAFEQLVAKANVVTSIILALVIILFIITATLSLGTRTYQAPFIWSSNTSFEKAGMHGTRAEPIMSFFNTYCGCIAFNAILTDDR